MNQFFLAIWKRSISWLKKTILIWEIPYYWSQAGGWKNDMNSVKSFFKRKRRGFLSTKHVKSWMTAKLLRLNDGGSWRSWCVGSGPDQKIQRDTIRPLCRLSEHRTMSKSCRHVSWSRKRTGIFADTTINVNPTAEDLAEITVQHGPYNNITSALELHCSPTPTLVLPMIRRQRKCVMQSAILHQKFRHDGGRRNAGKLCAQSTLAQR